MTVFDSFGYWRTGKPISDRSPISRMRRLTTSAKTGRRTKMSVKADFMRGASVGRNRGGGRRLGLRLLHRHVADELVLPAHNDGIARLQPLEDGHLVIEALAGLDEAAHRAQHRLALRVLRLGVFAQHEDRVAVERIVDGGLRYGDDVGSRRQH